MSKDKTYRKLINSVQWRELRARKLEINPTCQRCEAEGRVRAANVVHHITPVESARDEREAEQLCYSLSNLQSLCQMCHSEIHNRVRYNDKKAHKVRSQCALERWKDRNGIPRG